jgi:hypothetical protein
MKPAWDSSAAPHVPAIRPDRVSFNKPTAVFDGKHKTAVEIAKERKEAKSAAAEAESSARAEAERTRLAHLPEWKRRMVEEKEAKVAQKAIPTKALEQRRIQVENMFNDLPPWQRERAIKKEKKRIEETEGVAL